MVLKETCNEIYERFLMRDTGDDETLDCKQMKRIWVIPW